MVLKKYTVQARTATKSTEGHCLTLIFINPGSHERMVGGGGLERFDQIAELHPTLLHSRKSGVLVSRMTDRYSGSLAQRDRPR